MINLKWDFRFIINRGKDRNEREQVQFWFVLSLKYVIIYFYFVSINNEIIMLEFRFARKVKIYEYRKRLQSKN